MDLYDEIEKHVSFQDGRSYSFKFKSIKEKVFLMDALRDIGVNINQTTMKGYDTKLDFNDFPVLDVRPNMVDLTGDETGLFDVDILYTILKTVRKGNIFYDIEGRELRRIIGERSYIMTMAEIQEKM